MSKRKREDGAAQNTDPRERGDAKRRKKERRAASNGQDHSTHEASTPDHLGSPGRSDGKGVERTSTKRERRKAKREERHEEEAQNIKIRRKEHKKNRKDSRRYREPQWSVSVPVGGQMLALDPLFSPDEEYLLIAYDTAINVYSTSTSLPVRKLRTKLGAISGFTFSGLDSNHLYTSTSSGLIEEWEWVKGMRLGLWNTKVPIHSITTSAASVEDNSNGLVYTIDRHKENRWLVTGHRLVGAEQAAKTDLVVLLNHQKPLTSLKVVDNGRLIVATAGSSVVIGTTSHADQPSMKDITYVWREFECSEWISSIDIRVDDANETPNVPRKSNTSGSSLNVVVGGLKGAVFIYEDILNKLLRKERRSQTSAKDQISPRKLYWHRNAVSALKWSRDGNYAISGGDETVLVLWQLETGQGQFLPHLSAAIESIVVSPSGSSYAIRLADNSAMVLSTSELQPTFSIAGVQLPAIGESLTREPFVPSVSKPRRTRQSSQYQRSSAAVTSTGSNRLLLAVPATASPDASKGPCYLQTLDVVTGQQIARQALTRTNITSRNMGPDMNKIDEPSVTHLEISHNGQCLATVDEWAPPPRDLDHLASKYKRAESQQEVHLETYLKFWSWNEASQSWELVSRIDSPHATLVGDPCKVVELASDPSGIGFATLGEDGTVRLWKPTIRERHGLYVRATDGTTLVNWGCRKVIHLPTQTGPSGKTGYSADGSVLFAAIDSTLPSTIHLIDTESGEVQTSLEGLLRGPLFNLGILDRYLIILSDELCVWDMVSNEMEFGLSFDLDNQDLEEKRATMHLAIDHKHRSFAVAIPESGSGHRTRLAIFRPDRPAPIYTTGLPCALTSLQPAAGRVGYWCIDTAAEIRTLMPKQSLPAAITSSVDDRLMSSSGIANIYGGDQPKHREAVLKLSTVHVESEPDEDRRDMDRVASQAKLSEIFEAGSATSFPPVADLFEKVAMLFAGK